MASFGNEQGSSDKFVATEDAALLDVNGKIVASTPFGINIHRCHALVPGGLSLAGDRFYFVDSSTEPSVIRFLDRASHTGKMANLSCNALTDSYAFAVSANGQYLALGSYVESANGSPLTGTIAIVDIQSHASRALPVPSGEIEWPVAWAGAALVVDRAKQPRSNLAGLGTDGLGGDLGMAVVDPSTGAVVTNLCVTAWPSGASAYFASPGGVACADGRVLSWAGHMLWKATSIPSQEKCWSPIAVSPDAKSEIGIYGCGMGGMAHNMPVMTADGTVTEHSTSDNACYGVSWFDSTHVVCLNVTQYSVVDLTDNSIAPFPAGYSFGGVVPTVLTQP